MVFRNDDSYLRVAQLAVYNAQPRQFAHQFGIGISVHIGIDRNFIHAVAGQFLRQDSIIRDVAARLCVNFIIDEHIVLYERSRVDKCSHCLLHCIAECIALRFIPTLFEETQKIIAAQKARGASFDTGGLIARAKALLPVLIPLFVNSFRRADELAFAMDARCYNATEHRTKLKVMKLGIADFVGFLLIAAYFVAVLLDRYYFGGAMDTLIFGGLV